MLHIGGVYNHRRLMVADLRLATRNCEPRQVRKEAAVVVDVCAKVSRSAAAL